MHALALIAIIVVFVVSWLGCFWIAMCLGFQNTLFLQLITTLIGPCILVIVILVIAMITGWVQSRRSMRILRINPKLAEQFDAVRLARRKARAEAKMPKLKMPD